jgi:signal transduction histidine kinase
MSDRLRLILPLRLWLVLSHGLVLCLPLLAVLGTGALANDLQMQTKAELVNQAAWVEVLAVETLRDARRGRRKATLDDVGPKLTPLLTQAREATLAGVRLLNPDGVVIATSGDGLGEDLSALDEVQVALAGEIASTARPRPPPSTRQPLDSVSRRAPVRLYVATPVRLDGEIIGAVLLMRTPREELQALYHMAPTLGLGLLAALGVTLLLVFVSAQVLSRSLRRLSLASQTIAQGGRDAVSELVGVQRSHVAEVGQLAVSVTEMTQALQSRLSYIREFAGNVSHEFKTPLATLKGSVELLRDDDAMPAEQRERFLSNAHDELNRLERLVSGLLALARAEELGQREAVDLDALLGRVAARWPQVRLGGAAGTLPAASAQLESAVENLVQNAVTHGGPDVTVQVNAWREPGAVVIEVLDDGRGISPANLPQIFDRFFTTDRARGGTGLGLALVKAVVTAHNGVVRVESVPGRTCFTLRLSTTPRAALTSR